MANTYITRLDARFHAWQGSFATDVSGPRGDPGLTAALMGPRSGSGSATQQDSWLETRHDMLT
jgi:hypothetical protein